MKLYALVSAGVLLLGCSSLDVLGTRAAPQGQGAGGEGGGSVEDPVTQDPPKLPNLLEERKQIPLSLVNAQLNDAFAKLFFGNPQTEAVFVDREDGTGFIQDIANGDVRTDSMGYGLLATVQLNQRDVFDKLWAWAKKYMLSTSGPSKGLLHWRCGPYGTYCSSEAATDAMSIIATTLFMAQTRWADAGSHPYGDDALALLDAMVGIEERNGGIVDGVGNCIDVEAALPRGSSIRSDDQVPVDYLMPAFYEIWAEHDPSRASLWLRMAKNARDLLDVAPDPRTGLYPEEIFYSGDPVPSKSNYRVTTSRTLLNLTLDHLWYGPEPWVVEQNEQLLDFFLAQGVPNYVAEYTTDGSPLLTYNTAAHRSLVALAAGTTKGAKYDIFLQVLLDEKIPTGIYRYYDGMLYMLSLLVLSGQMTP